MKYYVYSVELNKETVYVGMGSGERIAHVLSGKSHSAELNELYFRYKLLGEERPKVRKVIGGLTLGQARKEEKLLIGVKQPICNKKLKRSARIVDQLLSVKEEDRTAKGFIASFAKELNVSKDTVRRVARQSNIKINSTLTDEQRSDIIRLRSEGETTVKLAKQFKVTSGTISNVCRVLRETIKD